jgi:hypothetical protein
MGTHSESGTVILPYVCVYQRDPHLRSNLSSGLFSLLSRLNDDVSFGSSGPARGGQVPPHLAPIVRRSVGEASAVVDLSRLRMGAAGRVLVSIRALKAAYNSFNRP